jgi:hypothetical protein
MFISEKFMGDVPGYFPVCSAAFGAPASSTACSGEISFRAGAVPGAPATSANIGRNEIGAFMFVITAKLQKPQRKCSQYGLILEQPSQNSILFVRTLLFNRRAENAKNSFCRVRQSLLRGLSCRAEV